MYVKQKYMYTSEYFYEIMNDDRKKFSRRDNFLKKINDHTEKKLNYVGKKMMIQYIRIVPRLRGVNGVCLWLTDTTDPRRSDDG